MKPNKVVVDSSVIIKWLNKTNEERVDSATRLMEAVADGEIILITPELAKYEVCNALLIKKKLTSLESKISLASLYTLPIKFGPLTRELAEDTYEIAHKIMGTFYDCSFLALAKQENAILVTDNPKHQGKFKGVKVIPLSEY